MLQNTSVGGSANTPYPKVPSIVVNNVGRLMRVLRVRSLLKIGDVLHQVRAVQEYEETPADSIDNFQNHS